MYHLLSKEFYFCFSFNDLWSACFFAIRSVGYFENMLNSNYLQDRNLIAQDDPKKKRLRKVERSARFLNRKFVGFEARYNPVQKSELL